MESEAICFNTFQQLSMEGRESLSKFSLHLEKGSRGLTLSAIHVKRAFLEETKVEVMLEDRANDLDLLALVEKGQNMLVVQSNKV